MKRDIYHIISDYFSGRITAADKQFLESWRNASEENKAMFDELERVWILTGYLYTKIATDVDAEWNYFVKNRNNPDISGKKSIGFNRNLFRVAAVLLPAILLISFLFYQVYKKNEWITFAANNNKANITLADGSVVYLNKNSSLEYKRKFTGKERIVKLHGEAFFIVSKTGSPFVVYAGKTFVKVLGTRFNVKCYGQNTNSEVIVEEGKVLFASKTESDKNVILIHGEKGTYSCIDSTILKEEVKSSNSFSWVTQKLVFNNTPLAEVSNDIENYFGKKIILSQALSDCLFSGEFSNPQMDNVLSVVSLSVGCTYKIENDAIYLEGGACSNK